MPVGKKLLTALSRNFGKGSSIACRQYIMNTTQKAISTGIILPAEIAIMIHCNSIHPAHPTKKPAHNIPDIFYYAAILPVNTAEFPQ